MSDLFFRSPKNPILKPQSDHWWESKKLYNPGVIFDKGKYHMLYRAMGAGENWKSSIGYAVSDNGEDFHRFNEPALTGVDEYEMRGLEDPRITKIGDTYYMAYASFDGVTPRLSIAISKDLIHWDKKGPVFADWQFEQAGGVRIKFDDGKPTIKPKLTEWSKSGAIFPELINGKYVMMFGEYNIWFAESTDGINWIGDQTPFLNPRLGDYFDNTFVEMGPPPIKTEMGWLVLYHGINDKHWYQVGCILLDLQNPRKIIHRSISSIFKPEMSYEMTGIVDVLPGGLHSLQKMNEKELQNFIIESDKNNTMPRVVFCCGATLVDDELRIFYGAGDSVICTATANIQDILHLVK
ncbi:MAG: hypothetical protein WCK11_05590 [Candidatus Falkowbacteria bacterium]